MALESRSIEELLGDEADDLLTHKCETVSKDKLYLPSPSYVDDVWYDSDRSPRVLRNLQALLDHGRLGGTGFLSILPVDQGIEHSGGASFAPNPAYFDPEKIAELAIEGGCNGLASSFGVIGAIARKYAHKIPMIVKLNHNQSMTYPNDYNQIMFSSAERAYNMGAVAVGATIYFGSQKADRQIQEVAKAFEKAHDLGLATILWCYTRNSAFEVNGTDYHASADLTGQANHLGVSIQADIIKQKQPVNNGGYKALNMGDSSYGKLDEDIYDKLASEHPIDLTRYQVLNCYMGRAGLINSGGSSGENDFAQAVRTAVINKRAGGMGLISGRKAFQRPMEEGTKLLHFIQDVYLDEDITVA